MSELRLDLGCGPKPREGFTGVDVRDYGRTDILVCDLRGPWKWDDGSVTEVFCSHFVEHLTAPERTHFANELYRVLAPGGTAEIIVPHYASGRAYGDLTHQWPPVSEFWFLYLGREWRESNAPHADVKHCVCIDQAACCCYACDFTVDWGVSLDPHTQLRNQEYQQFASRYYREAAQDIVSTWRKAQ